jgi:hypothetical protein
MTGYESKKAMALDKLAQPAQEPVAWMNPSWIDPDTRGWQSDSFESIPIEGWLPLYTTPPQRPWVGLTDEEIKSLPSWWPSYEDAPALVQLVKDVEAKLKEKNT